LNFTKPRIAIFNLWFCPVFWLFASESTFLSVPITASLYMFMVLWFCAVNQHHQHRLWCVPCNSYPSWFGLVCLIPYSVAAAIVFKKIVQYVEEISFTHILIDLSSFMRILYSTSLLIEFSWSLLNTWWNVPLHSHFFPSFSLVDEYNC